MKYSVALLSALTALTPTAYGLAFPFWTTQYYDVCLDATAGFSPNLILTVNPGDQITFLIDGDVDHEIVQSTLAYQCVTLPGGLDSGIRYAGVNTTYVYSVPDPVPSPAVVFYDSALMTEEGECTQIIIQSPDN